MRDVIDGFVSDFLAVDDGLWLRLLGLVIAFVFLWRLVFIAIQTTPATLPRGELEPVPPPTVIVRPRRSLFPSRIEKLERAIELVTRETDLALANTNAVHASRDLVEARAQLANVIRELTLSPHAPATQPRQEPALTQVEIGELIDAIDLDADTHATLARLIAARLQERRS